MKYQVLIIHGEIQSGKTRKAKRIADRARGNGFKVHGVLSTRVLRFRETIGYDMYDLMSRKTQPIVYKKEYVEGEGWTPLRGPFVFKETAFTEANRLLKEAAYRMDNKTLVVVDEFGHLEARGFGMYPGLRLVVDSLGKGKLLVICRTDKVDNVLNLFRQSETNILVMEATQKDFMTVLADSFI